MKSSTQLDSVVFHLTPTRTRCDLIIIANGKKEKIASGLLNPFLAHLKTAEDQIAKGGYSIFLEPDPDNDATWFTKGTVERFVRFVSTPEILERVSTLESEILQIEEAIAIQGNNDTGHCIIEEHQSKPAGCGEGNKTKPDPDEEKAIVLYKPETHQSKANGECSQEGNSRVQLLKVLETRKSVLKKEQGMAFARAVAASFDIDHLPPLVSFADCFGAVRLRDACLRFVDLWKKKHETGQWVEIEAAEAMSSRADFCAMNASGIVLASMANKQNDLNNEKSEVDITAGERATTNNQAPVGFQGQFPHPVFPAWPMHSPPGTLPMYPVYPVQGMPYYQAFPGNVPFYQPPYSPMEDSQTNATPKTRKKRQSVGDRDGQDSDSADTGTSMDGTELDREASKSRASRQKTGWSSKRQSGRVVIRNINYITSEAKNSGGDGLDSDETGTEGEDFQADDLDTTSNNTAKSSKRKGSHSKTNGESNTETEGGHWQAFQSFLLSGADEENQHAKDSLFAMENDGKVRRKQNTVSEDPLALGGLDSNDVGDRRLTTMNEANGNVSRKLRVSKDGMVLSGAGSHVVKGINSQMDMHVMETNGRRVSRNGNDDFIIGSREDQSYLRNSSDPLAVSGVEYAGNKVDGASSHDIVDESFIVPFRSMALNQVGPEDRTPIDLDSEFPPTYQKPEDVGTVRYEPDDLSMMPERGTEKGSTGYDPALDYEMVEYDEGSILVQSTKESVTDAKKSEKSRNAKVTSVTADKRRTAGPIWKGKPSKLSPLEDARARADKLRAFKADIQKMKKEKEEADLKRLEALKLQRQKRIAARASSGAGGSTTPIQQQKKLPMKLSPISNRGSKFSDVEPGSSSPLQRSKLRTSLGPNGSNKASISKTTRSAEGSLLPGNRLSRSVSSLPEQKKESSISTPESKTSMARIRRLSEPKTVGQHSGTITKGRSSESVTKQKSGGPDSKKISAIINLDKSKAASLPELKIRTPRGPSDVVQDESVGRKSPELQEAKPSVTSEHSEPHLGNAKLSNPTDADDNQIVEKTVVMLEYDKPSVPTVHASGDNGVQNSQFHNHGKVEEHEAVSVFVSMRAPPSPNDGRDILPAQKQEQSTSHEERTNLTEDSQKLSNNTTEKPYQAPFARVSSLEDASTRNSDYGKALPNIQGMMSTSKAYVIKEKTYRVDSIPETSVNDITYRIDSISETSGKSHGKESSKGFRRLLKFGKKSHNSLGGDESIDSESASTNAVMQQNNPTSVASNEVYTLKNLISEDDTSISGNASQKSSRHFSLLSPFRIKTSEKKLAT